MHGCNRGAWEDAARCGHKAVCPSFACRAGGDAGAGVEEDPEGEFTGCGGPDSGAGGPRIINVGVPGPGGNVPMWRRSWRDKVCHCPLLKRLISRAACPQSRPWRLVSCHVQLFLAG